MDKISIDDLNRVFAAELATHKPVFEAKAERASLADGLPIPLFTVTGAAETFCTAWPSVQGFLSRAINTIGWLFPNQAAKAKALIAAINKVVIPAICGSK